MCGIVGILQTHGEVERELLARMRDALTHRGPDDAGLHLDGRVGLGHRRLSILDLSPGGHQPMASPDGSLWIVFNGEIFNYVELREELRARGQEFRSTSDTEVLLHLYAREGEACLEKLNGMFAFAIWNARERSLFAARDRLGIKPFYYYPAPDCLLFASELKALLEDPRVAREPDREALADILFAGFPLEGKTPIRGVRQLPPGTALHWREGSLELRPYWDLRYDYDRERSDARWIDDVADLLEDAVRIHCRSDAPLGCHLSGGLDSSTVSSLAARYVHPLETFSIRFDEGGGFYDETPHAQAVAEQIGATFLDDLVLPGELRDLLPALVHHMDGPLQNTGGFTYFTVSRLASRHVKVSITGHGGDEIFAGYPAQFRMAFGRTDMFDLAGQSAERIPALSRLRGLLRREGIPGLFRRAAAGLHSRELSFEELWVSLHCAEAPERNPLLHRDFVRALGGYAPREPYLRALREAPTEEALDRCLYHDLRCYLPGLLHLEDRVSMAVSVESRVPLLDYRLVELLARVPPEVKVRGLVPKRLLRAVSERLLPESVRSRRDKTPFAVPLARWFQGELKPLLDEVLFSEPCLGRGVFDPDRLRDDSLGPSKLWAALNLELWFRIVIDRDPEWTARTSAIATGATREASPDAAPGSAPAARSR
jgi:asparagine synthase (glutamine-hydrolysing)